MHHLGLTGRKFEETSQTDAVPLQTPAEKSRQEHRPVSRGRDAPFQTTEYCVKEILSQVIFVHAQHQVLSTEYQEDTKP